jgi:molybdenum cofactor biosynthesis enzyme
MTVAEVCEHIAHKGENTNTHRILIGILYVRRTVEIISQMSGEG